MFPFETKKEKSLNMRMQDNRPKIKIILFYIGFISCIKMIFFLKKRMIIFALRKNHEISFLRIYYICIISLFKYKFVELMVDYDYKCLSIILE